jgi:hypothetical protein
VSKVHDDGKTYDLTFDDGRKLRRVKERKIRSLDSGSEDDRRARRKDKGSDDDDRRRKERKRYERRDSSDEDEASFKEGDKVEAKVGGRSRRPGKIRKVHADGTYDIEMDDGERERNVPSEHIRKAKRSKSSKFSVDDRVEVKIKSKWVKGKVKRTHKDGTIDVDASNGEKARRIDAELVRARDGSDDEGGSKISVGDKVRAKYKVRDSARKLNLTPSTRVSRRVRSTQGRAKEYDGVIKEAHSDGTYTIKSDAVHKANCRGSSPPPLNHGLHAIDATPVRWHGNVVSHRSIPSTRLTVRFPHRYDDGEIETYVNKKFITVTRAKSRSRSRSKSDDSRSKKNRRDRSRSSSSSRSRSPKRGRKLREGDKCEARFRGKSSAKYGRGVLRPSTSHRWRRGVTRHRAGTTKARCLAFIRTAL